MAPERTGRVRVTFANDRQEIYLASNYADAARQAPAGRGSIRRFEWVANAE